MSLHYNGTNSYLFVDKAEIYKFKAHNNMRWYEFSLGFVLTDFMKYEQSEISLNGTVWFLARSKFSWKRRYT